MENIIEILIQLAFETGQAYQRIYDKIGLDNIVNFKDIAYANDKGAQWNLKGDMSDLPKLFKIHNFDKNKIDTLNEIAKQLENIKNIAKSQLINCKRNI